MLINPKCGNYKTIVYVLAGGRGSRLRSLGVSRSKPMMFVDTQKRIIHFVLDAVREAGLPYASVIIQYDEQSVRDKLGNKYSGFEKDNKNDVSLDLISPNDIFPNEYNPVYVHTADALRKVHKKVTELHGPAENYVILPGDGLADKDIVNMILDEHEKGVKKGHIATVALKEFPEGYDLSAFGLANVNNGEIVEFREKEKNPQRWVSRYVNMFYQVHTKNGMEYVMNSNEHDLSKVLEQIASDRSYKLGAAIIPEETLWWDLGSPEALLDAAPALIEMKKHGKKELLIHSDMVYDKATNSLVHKNVLKKLEKQRDYSGTKWIEYRHPLNGSFRDCMIGDGLRMFKGAKLNHAI
ncbi:MAG: hypothetical protein GXO64_03485, partial [Candidatus Micrarchaeota archaeon]|nr:hypothetical protein [Candidatus Micrarchaeota archaeon]